MSITKVASFADGHTGGNPAGVHIADQHPSDLDMQAIAYDIGFSETAFAHRTDDGWRVRYFSPENEVPFCGHATIALGAVLAKQFGSDTFPLILNNATISVTGETQDTSYHAALQSPPTYSKPMDANLLRRVLDMFGYTQDDLDASMPPAFAHAGANHLVIALSSRDGLRAMNYDLEAGRILMLAEDLVTIMFVYAETPRYFHSRNAFASGGVLEDPATGAATAAFAGYLRDLGWPHEGAIDLVQGEDMGSRSLLHAQIPAESGSSIRVSGSVRFM